MNLYVWGLSFFAAFGGFLFGYDIGVINGVKDMHSFRKTFNLSYDVGNKSQCSEDVQESTVLGLIVSVFSLGCLIGALVGGVLSDFTGRKPAIMIGGSVFVVGGAIQGTAYYIWMILLGRVVAGIGVGILSMVVPVYNAELAPKSLRGRLVSLNQLAITAGIMVSFIIDLVCEKFTVGWRVALGLQCVLGTILIIGMLLLPESPRWLVRKHRDQKAAKVLARIRRSTEEEIREELSEIQASLGANQKANVQEMWKAFLEWKIVKRVIIGMMLQLFQQFTGMNVLMYYSTSIFCKIGVASYASTAAVGSLNFLTTILSIFLVDKVGRKVLLLLGALGMMFSMLVAATLILEFKVEEGENKEVGYVVVLFVCFFVFNFAYGWGPVAWVVTSEIFPLNIRGIAVSLTTSANWIGNFVIAMVTPILLASTLQTHGTFYIIAVLLAAAFLFVLLTLPETKGESLERIEGLFSKPWLERINLFYYLRCGCPWWHSTQHYRGLDLTHSQPSEDENGDRVLLLHTSHGENDSKDEEIEVEN